MKVITILGARPQFIKAAVVSKALRDEGIDEAIIHTGQHFDYNMSQIFFDEMEIPTPDYNLGIHGMHHGAMTGRMVEKVEEILIIEKPDYVLVYGDTNSTLAGSLAAVKLQIPIAHIEAGLRSFDINMPEEINRILTDRISNLLFCPTTTAINNLEREGFRSFPCEIIFSGDVMYDSVLFYKEKARAKSNIIEKLTLQNKKFILATLHRAENTDNVARLKEICGALNKINDEVEIILPLHPRTKTFLKENNIQLKVTLTDPVSYFDILCLLEHCSMVMTDSGGLQKEAYFFNKNCLTLRDQTEWTELVDSHANWLCGANESKILQAFRENFDKIFDKGSSLYGSGKSSQIIARKLKIKS